MPADPIVIKEGDIAIEQKLLEIKARVSSVEVKDQNIDIEYVDSKSKSSRSSSPREQTEKVLGRFQQLLMLGGPSVEDYSRTIKALKIMGVCREESAYTQSKTFSHKELTLHFDHILNAIGRSFALLVSHGLSEIWHSIAQGLKVNISTSDNSSNVEQKKEIRILFDDENMVKVMVISFYATDDVKNQKIAILGAKDRHWTMDCGLFKLVVFKEFLLDQEFFKPISKFLSDLLSKLRTNETKPETQEMRSEYFDFGMDVQETLMALGEEVRKKKTESKIII